MFRELLVSNIFIQSSRNEEPLTIIVIRLCENKTRYIWLVHSLKTNVCLSVCRSCCLSVQLYISPCVNLTLIFWIVIGVIFLRSKESKITSTQGQARWICVVKIKISRISDTSWGLTNTLKWSSVRRAVHSSHQFFGEVTNQITNFKSPFFLFQVIKMCCMIQLWLRVRNVYRNWIT